MTRLKGKLTQVKLFEEIVVSESKVQRSQTTGVLLVTLKKVRTDHSLLFDVKAKADKKHFAKQEVEKIKEANVDQLIANQKKLKELELRIKEDADLDDLPDLE